MLIFSVSASSQSVKELFSNSGIWCDYSTPAISAKTYPDFKGRLANINWSDIELQPNVWDWSIFDEDITEHTQDSLPVIFLVYTGDNAPQWLYSNNVPQVIATNPLGAPVDTSPYYLDSNYNFYFKRMITQVRQHVQSLQPPLRNLILAVQACFGNTGDPIGYKGIVPAQYAISSNQFDSLFKVYSLYYYNEYKGLSPAIKMLSNTNDFTPNEQYWLNANCPGGWKKCGTIGKGFQLNTELDKFGWMYNIMNQPYSGEYIKSRCEIVGSQLYAGWWTSNQYKSMFALTCYEICWGLDWPDETATIIQNPKFDSAMHFFNKYAGQKVPAVATNALCALKDVLDASDVIRFPESIYGTADQDNLIRYINIWTNYILYGAKLDDQSVITGNQYDCLAANGTNDVGWRLLPGNYERYLHQIDANITSAGYWNINPENNEAMYGRFGRGFDLANGKNALYFDVDDAFLRSIPLNSKYPVTIEITYYDNGIGSWKLFYDAQSNSNKACVAVTCGNTNTWKKKTVTLTDAFFGNRSTRKSDFYIKSTNAFNVIFSTVELSRPAQSAAGFVTTPLTSFDTVCFNGISDSETFVLNGAYLNGADVQVGPLTGFLFSTNSDTGYGNSITFSNYGTQFNSTVYVKMNTGTAGFFRGNIPITGGGVTSASVGIKGTVLNTSPVLNAVVNQISCYNKNDGAIDLQPTGGVQPFTYYWSSSGKPNWHDTVQDINNLSGADYKVVLNSSSGCSTTKIFTIINPPKLIAPAGINGPGTVQQNQSGLIFSVVDSNNSYQYSWGVPPGALINSGLNTPSVSVTWGKVSGNITVKAQNNCGTSPASVKLITVSSSLNGIISHNQSNTALSNIVYPFRMPDPDKNITSLKFYGNSDLDYTIQTAGAAGKIISLKNCSAKPRTNSEMINTQKPAPGYYIVALKK